MPLRPFSREQAWLLPPTLDQLLPKDHPARFVAAFVDKQSLEEWQGLGCDLDGDPLGAPAYHPRALLSVWIYGFMIGIRSSRKLEAGRRDQIPFLWLTGRQSPDHNSLWRFYRAHRQGMRRLLKDTVRTAVKMDLVDLALQAVDGAKVAANASHDGTLDAEGLERLLQRTVAAIAELEAQNATGGDAPPARLPEELAQERALGERVREALERVQQEDSPRQINLTDPDARVLKARGGFVTGYNAQAMVAPLDLPPGVGGGMLITATDVVSGGDDQPSLLPMMEAAEVNTGGREGVTTLADGGYYSGANLAACAQQGRRVLMAEPQQRKREKNPYHKGHFTLDGDSEIYRCPQGAKLRYVGRERHENGYQVRIYQAPGATCVSCPAFGICTRSRRGRKLKVGEYEAQLEQHRKLMALPQVQVLYKRRKELPEPVFGIIKEQQGGRRFLLRGQANVKAEWALLATAFNLRTLYRIYRAFLGVGRGTLLSPVAA
jgi:transposase